MASHALQDARALSSGTIATLTGQRTYDRIDAIQAAFIAWIEREQREAQAEYETWIEAWAAFVQREDEPK